MDRPINNLVLISLPLLSIPILLFLHRRRRTSNSNVASSQAISNSEELATKSVKSATLPLNPESNLLDAELVHIEGTSKRKYKRKNVKGLAINEGKLENQVVDFGSMQVKGIRNVIGGEAKEGNHEKCARY
jgi:hypothetical protein